MAKLPSIFDIVLRDIGVMKEVNPKAAAEATAFLEKTLAGPGTEKQKIGSLMGFMNRLWKKQPLSKSQAAAVPTTAASKELLASGAPVTPRVGAKIGAGGLVGEAAPAAPVKTPVAGLLKKIGPAKAAAATGTAAAKAADLSLPDAVTAAAQGTFPGGKPGLKRYLTRLLGINPDDLAKTAAEKHALQGRALGLSAGEAGYNAASPMAVQRGGPGWLEQYRAASGETMPAKLINSEPKLPTFAGIPAVEPSAAVMPGGSMGGTGPMPPTAGGASGAPFAGQAQTARAALAATSRYQGPPMPNAAMPGAVIQPAPYITPQPTPLSEMGGLVAGETSPFAGAASRMGSRAAQAEPAASAAARVVSQLKGKAAEAPVLLEPGGLLGELKALAAGGGTSADMLAAMTKKAAETSAAGELTPKAILKIAEDLSKKGATEAQIAEAVQKAGAATKPGVVSRMLKGMYGKGASKVGRWGGALLPTVAVGFLLDWLMSEGMGMEGGAGMKQIGRQAQKLQLESPLRMAEAQLPNEHAMLAQALLPGAQQEAAQAQQMAMQSGALSDMGWR